MEQNDNGWDIMSGTAVETIKAKEITISGKGMNKLEFDALILLFSTGIELRGWKKAFSGLSLKGDFEAIFIDEGVI